MTETCVGVVPVPLGRESESVRSTLRVLVLMTPIWSSLAIATKARARLGSIAIPSGWERWAPTWIVFVTCPDARSIAETVPWVSLVTNP